MNLSNNSIKLIFSLFLMVIFSNTYAKSQVVDTQVQEAAAEAMEAEEAVPASDTEAACRADDACDVASDVSDDERYGGIEQEYIVKGCKVTIYNDGPVKMVNVKTNKPCNAPIPKDHKFSKETRTYQENGCTITESKAADGITDAVMDCSKRDKTK
ncbi:hypothetical protein [Acinetobacter sp.]|jgi:hypothetical protein|uniref:hypothetical protein n=1 Tax=Acinetobacter sp. TaxID=472 RepID=UPI0028367C64|nr:hypothetical protein [Acinetobacter sp.]MDR0235191.1 hypothetical protein [Acinetobacter sp.]